MSRKCVECEHDLFTMMDSSNNYYCLVHHPDKYKIIEERRAIENIHLGIDYSPTNESEQRLTNFYKKIISNKNNEIQKLKDEIHELTQELRESRRT